MGILKRQNGRIDFVCSDCKTLCYTPYSRDGKLLKNFLKWKKWLRFRDGRTFCPECLKRRSMDKLMFSWGKFLRRRHGLCKKTGIDDNTFLYRYWQLSGVFPNVQYKYGYETYVREEGQYVHVLYVPGEDINNGGCTIYITRNGKIQFSHMVEVG